MKSEEIILRKQGISVGDKRIWIKDKTGNSEKRWKGYGCHIAGDWQEALKGEFHQPYYAKLYKTVMT